MNKIALMLLIGWTLYWQEQGFFRQTEIHYCKKFKGNCELCDCWSCQHDKKQYK